MAVIGVTLNEVLRDFLGQFIYVYEKYVKEVDLEVEDIKDFNLLNNFEFNNLNELNKFLYSNSSLEIFGHADQMEDNIMNHFNMFVMDINDDEDHEVKIILREVDKAIPSTLFFLSKFGCRAEHIKFVKTYSEVWDEVDVLVTANPTLLKTKPKEKLSIKIKSSYNDNAESDFILDNFNEFIRDEELRNKILNSKITKLN